MDASGTQAGTNTGSASASGSSLSDSREVRFGVLRANELCTGNDLRVGGFESVILCMKATTGIMKITPT